MPAVTGSRYAYWSCKQLETLDLSLATGLKLCSKLHTYGLTTKLLLSTDNSEFIGPLDSGQTPSAELSKRITLVNNESLSYL